MKQQYELLDFGKHNGKSIDQVDDAYLQWMHRSFSEASQWKGAAYETLKARKERTADLLSNLKSCSLKRDLQWGKRIHAEAVRSGNASNIYVQTALMKMYAKCNRMGDARQVFDSIHKPNVVCWTALLLGYAENGQGHVSLVLYSVMKDQGCTPDSVTYIAALKACTSLALKGDKTQCLELGTKIHADASDNLELHVQNTLIDMYAKCGSMTKARQVFDSIQKPDVVSWTVLLLGYAENGEGRICLDLFCKMKADGCAPNSLTHIAAIKACTSLAVNGDKARGLEMGSKIHLEIGDKLDPCVQSALIGMYAKCGSLCHAHRVFDSFQEPDVVSWTALLLGYAENGKGQACLDLFLKMKASGCVPDSVSYVAALKACTSLALTGDFNVKAQCLERGRKLHSQIGEHMDPCLQNTLIDMYAKCGSMFDARLVFDSMQQPSVVSWTSLVLGYAENGEGHVALDVFSEMKATGCAPDSVTYLAALKACTALAENGDDSGLETGRRIHSDIGHHLNPCLQSNLIDMYAKCGSMADAAQVFHSIQKPDIVCWTAVILGYATNGDGHAALQLFSKMEAAGYEPDSVAYVAALKACGSIGALALGRKFHSAMKEFTVYAVTCLVDFYAKCGSIGEARGVFDLHPEARDITTWNALVAGYSSCGDTASVLSLFEAMQDAGFRPNGVTFVCVLLCCSHAGLVAKAKQYWEAMPVQFGVIPEVAHYNCMVDALGRANLMMEALAVLQQMPCSPNAVTWGALLGACCKWRNAEIGRIAFESLKELGEPDASAYVLMSHICGRGMLEKQLVAEKLRRGGENG